MKYSLLWLNVEYKNMLIGILAVQGAFIEHANTLKKLGINSKEIRQKNDLKASFDGIILPGGESSVMGKLSRELDLFDTIHDKIEQGLPVFGTCAGMILLAKQIDNDERRHFATMDIEVVRNAYGRQQASFISHGHFAEKIIKMPFIRAPYISKFLSDKVEKLSVTDNKITAARQDNMLVTSFHPEVTQDSYVHEYFIKMIK